MRDGSLGYISIFNGSQVEAIDAMLSMGFHYLPSLDALKRSSFNMEGACSLLSADTPPNAGILPVGTKMLQIVTNVAISKQGSQLIKEAAQKQQSEEEEWQVFSAAADMFIDFQVPKICTSNAFMLVVTTVKSFLGVGSPRNFIPMQCDLA